MNQKKHHPHGRQKKAFLLSAIAATAALQLASCGDGAYIAYTTERTIAEAIASDTMASTLRTEPLPDMAPMETETSAPMVEEGASAEITSA